MTYRVDHKPAFDRDFIELPRNLQRQVTRAIADLREHAEEPRGNTIKKLGGYDRVWRYRQGDLRIIYDVNGNLVRLLALGNRRDIYDRFYGPPDLPDSGEYAAAVEELLTLDHPGLPKWVERMLEGLVRARQPERDRDAPLPKELTRERLDRWGIPPEHHDPLLECNTEGELLRCEVSQESVEIALEHLYPRPADQVAQQPDLQLEEPEDLIRYAEGDLVGFLLRLDSEQERYVDWALDGPTLVKGGPGSGKSTVALYRARALVENGAGKVLFTTYTNALVEFSRELLQRVMGDLPAELEVATLDSIAVQIVGRCDNAHLNIGGANEIKAGLTDAESRFSQDRNAQREMQLLSDSESRIRRDYLVEEIEWIIEGRNLSSVEDYLQTDRAGRGYGFPERTRRAVWRIYQHVREFLRERGIVTWGRVRARALELVQSNTWARQWDAVIVDEAQDLTPTALALCIELCDEPQGLFLTADASQSLYNRGFRWKDVHDELQIVGRTRILKKNYRSSRQIADASANILRGTGAGDEEALDQIYVHTGPRPCVHVCDGYDDQILCLTVEIEEASKDLRLPVSAAAVLTRSRKLARETADALNDWGLPARYMTSRNLNLECPQVKVLTIHSAKGLEFPVVALPFVEEDVLPRELDTDVAEDWEQHLAAERRLFYVGATRAMRRLVVTCRKDHRSPFLNDLDDASWRWA